jgi:hypothetical protein
MVAGSFGQYKSLKDNNHGKKRATNVGNIDLPATSTTTAARKAALGTAEWLLESLTSTAHAGGAFEASACGCRVAEARFGLSVFANVNEASHEVLVAERRNGVLSLLPSRILHDATALHPSKSQSTSILLTIKTSHQSLPLTFRSAGVVRLRRGLHRLQGC